MVLMVFFNSRISPRTCTVILRDRIALIATAVCRYFGNVTNWRCQVAGHGVHRIRKIFPGAADTGHVRLSAEISFRTHLARHASDFGRE